MAGKSYLSRPLAALAVALLVALGGNPAIAESACKGLEQSACGKKADCSWVKGYTRKDGVNVSGHCRTKNAKAGSKSTSSKSEKSKSKDQDKSGKEKKSKDTSDKEKK